MTPTKDWTWMERRIMRAPFDTCWHWTGSLNKGGYGILHDGTKNRMAHRWAYELLVGPIPEGLTIDHLCRVRDCVRPDHLQPVSIRVNLLRGTSPISGRYQMTHCINGHEFTPENTYVMRDGGRKCIECNRKFARDYHHRKKPDWDRTRSYKRGGKGKTWKPARFTPLPAVPVDELMPPAPFEIANPYIKGEKKPVERFVRGPGKRRIPRGSVGLEETRRA